MEMIWFDVLMFDEFFKLQMHVSLVKLYLMNFLCTRIQSRN